MMQKFSRLAASALVLGAMSFGSTAVVEAGFLKSLLRAADETLPAPMPVPMPTPGPMLGDAMPTPGPTTSYYPPSAGAPTVVYNATCTAASCIKYRNAIFDLHKAKNNPCLPPMQAVLCPTNPCTCCPIQIPVCLPNTCCDQPTVECDRGLFGVQIVSYKWCCGVTVNVRFDKRGDVTVVYRGT